MSVEAPTIDYPYVEGVGGLRMEDLTAFVGTVGDIEGASGRRIGFQVEEDELSFNDIESSYKLIASVDHDGVARFEVFTKNCTDFPLQPIPFQPDFYAGKFVGVALDHFERNGHPVRSIASEWRRISVNGKAYMNWMERLKDPLEAARRTWAGKTYGSYGFAPTHVKDDWSLIRVNFDKVEQSV